MCPRPSTVRRAASGRSALLRVGRCHGSPNRPAALERGAASSELADPVAEVSLDPFPVLLGEPTGHGLALSVGEIDKAPYHVAYVLCGVLLLISTEGLT